MKSNLGNTFIYFGYRFGLVAILAANILLFTVVATMPESVLHIIGWLIGLALGGLVSTLISKRRWTYKYDRSLPVPCLICSKEFTKAPSQLSPAGTMRHAEIKCPNCNGTTAY